MLTVLKLKVGNFIREVALSQKQFDVLREMYSTKVFLVTNEGENYKAWLQNSSLKSNTQVRITTAKSLYASGWIILSKTYHPSFSSWVYYELSPKAQKLFV